MEREAGILEGKRLPSPGSPTLGTPACQLTLLSSTWDPLIFSCVLYPSPLSSAQQHSQLLQGFSAKHSAQALPVGCWHRFLVTWPVRLPAWTELRECRLHSMQSRRSLWDQLT